ncbi:MAG TPA: FAD/NAD(P)-binding oxidoreductase [Phycisphaerales bacterium]|nr:FAD/NAD(P)-binding oxidoreductase [Phycisphaerales bacterium]
MHIHSDILIIGAGPAGLAAARAASQSPDKPTVTLVDENGQVGGQIWRRSAPPWAQELVGSAKDDRLRLLSGTSVVEPLKGGALLAVTQGQPNPLRLSYRWLILAVGARELFLPFPGWTLPGVMGAGGAQAMCKAGMDVRGKKIIVAGTGPLLLAVAVYLKQHGAVIPAIVEQTSSANIRKFAMSLWRTPAKLAQGVKLRASLLGVPYWTDAWPTRAAGAGSLQSVTIARASRGMVQDRTLDADLLACGFGLVPNTQLAALIGCEIKGGRVVVDDLQHTTMGEILCAGEPTGIGGVETALIEGEIAGLVASNQKDAAMRLRKSRLDARAFAARLNAAFALRSEVKKLAQDDTIMCRCEDATLGQLRRYTSWRDAKLQARCGMGPCQGRVCGPLLREVLGFEPTDARPPISPVPLGVLAQRHE